jgi:hypothetical protein
MNHIKLSEKQTIELASAEGFVAYYNAKYGTNYQIHKVAGDGETPDVLARDSEGNELGMEITLTEDRIKDIASALGRSDHKSGPALAAHLQRVKEGKDELRFNTLTGNVMDILLQRIKAKLHMRYGKDTALIVRDTSAVPWRWDDVADLVQSNLSNLSVPFDRGVWLVSRNKESVTNLFPESSK